MIWLVLHQHLTPNTLASPGVPLSMSKSADPPVPPPGPILPPPGMAAPPTPFEIYSAKVAAKATFREGEDVDWEGPESVPIDFEYSSEETPLCTLVPSMFTPHTLAFYLRDDRPGTNWPESNVNPQVKQHLLTTRLTWSPKNPEPSSLGRVESVDGRGGARILCAVQAHSG
jgi:hypothetical protein